MFEVILLAIALSMDAFAVAIGMGAKPQKRSERYLLLLALYAALYFGIAQGVMPLIGYLLGAVLLGWLASAAPWIGGIILIVLGGKMLVDVLRSDVALAIDATIDNACDSNNADTHSSEKINQRTLLLLAIATSVDAMAAGFTLNLLTINAWLACLIIAIITAIFSFFGVCLGNRSGTWLEDKAEFLGGVVLIAIGIKVILFR